MKLLDCLALEVYLVYLSVRRQQMKQVMKLHLIGKPVFDSFIGQAPQPGKASRFIHKRALHTAEDLVKSSALLVTVGQDILSVHANQLRTRNKHETAPQDSINYSLTVAGCCSA